MTEVKAKVIKSNTVILHTASLFLLPLQLLFSMFLLLRGHDEPGGGFIAGLVAAGAFVLYLFAHGVDSTRKILRVEPHDLIGAGLLFGVISALPAIFFGQALLTAQWWSFYLVGTEVKLSTVLLFDLGVYLVVMGSILTIVMSLNEAEE
ncbi:Na+/H+ antiporter subunit B [Marinimicrobium alkaliphilum]|uniref:Na+/H+ antiporter subunit B n=1 Tax=Marinimicrobium alkaliphilum TaxID=2202654 RepID=UPI001E4C5E9F|nr:Na+/H+ antiporter subunit B [Marinimicrobium alkaliphilum]